MKWTTVTETKLPLNEAHLKTVNEIVRILRILGTRRFLLTNGNESDLIVFLKLRIKRNKRKCLERSPDNVQLRSFLFGPFQNSVAFQRGTRFHRKRETTVRSRSSITQKGEEPPGPVRVYISRLLKNSRLAIVRRRLRFVRTTKNETKFETARHAEY